MVPKWTAYFYIKSFIYVFYFLIWESIAFSSEYVIAKYFLIHTNMCICERDSSPFSEIKCVKIYYQTEYAL